MQKMQEHFSAGTWAFGWLGDRFARLIALQLFDFGLDGRDVGVPGFLEHIPLQRRQGFALSTKTNLLVRPVHGSARRF